MTDEMISKLLSVVDNIEHNASGNITTYTIGNLQIVCQRVNTYPEDKKSLVNLWKKKGLISEVIPTMVCIDTYYDNGNDIIGNMYNITLLRESYQIETPTGMKKGVRYELNHTWLREATDENERELVARCIDMYLKDIPYYDLIETKGVLK